MNETLVRLYRLPRAVVRALPPPLRERVRSARRVLQTPRRPPDPRVPLSSHVLDRDQLYEYLADTDIFGEAQAECVGYLNDAIERFRITVSLVEQLLKNGRVLELGANPYFITRLLRRRGFDVTCANWFGDPAMGRRGTQTVTGARSGEQHVFEFDHFNVESDPFPYASGSFDLVLCCEILEHLPYDPVNMLAEIHRVLRPDRGWLLLTTPNPVRLDNLTRMLRAENVYEELSGYGTYGRHNREYTVSELIRLLEECGYTDLSVFATDIHPHEVPADVRLSGAVLSGRGDNLFAVGRAYGEERWPYPAWLYSSRHSLARRVRPDVRMGYNDALQTTGFHELETSAAGSFRWTSSAPARAHIRVTGRNGSRLRIDGVAPPAIAGSTIMVTAMCDGATASWTLQCDDAAFSIEAPVKVKSGDHEVTITTDRTWCPDDAAGSGDTRRLGIRVSRVAVES